MSRPPAPKTPRPPQTRRAQVRPQSGSRRTNVPPKAGLPLPMKRAVRRLFAQPRKVLWAGGSVATLALLAGVPAQVISQSVVQSSCREVVKSGAEISRGQLSQLLTIPEGASQAMVREAIGVPYCLLPAIADGSAEKTDVKAAEDNSEQGSGRVVVREAYPLAFDSEAWVVVNYGASNELDDGLVDSLGEYVGYDFVFRP